MTKSNRTYALKRWSLTDLFEAYDSPDMETAFAELESMVSGFESRREMLEADINADTFMGIVRELEEMYRLSNHVEGFAGLWFAEDTQNPDAQNFQAQVDQFMAGLQNRVLFFSLWWKALDDDNSQRLMGEAGDYGYWLEEMRHFKPHTLTEPEEKIINLKNVTGQNAVRTLYNMITNRYTYKIEVEGEEKELTRGELMVYVRHHEPEVRAKAYQELYRVYGEDNDILGQMYQTLVRDWGNEQVDLRHFSSPISTRNLVNDIPDEMVNTLLEVSERNATVFQRFFNLKARWIGIERLRRYDIYAPVVKSAKTYEFDTAAKMVLESFELFEPRIAEMAERVFTTDHLDSEVRKGKNSGAFCASLEPNLTPWVLMNYQGRADDVATLAHELGHAIHSMMASDHGLFTFHSSLPLAETASTFSEILLVDQMLEQESDEAVRRDILFRQVDDNYATIMRQAFFALFERKAHEMVKEGASVDELAVAYMENLRTQFGEAVEVSDEFRWEWISIPHIYEVPFYVYAYSFGQLLVLSLYQQFKEEGEAFKPRYLKILAAGGSDAPANVLSEAGIDMHSADFWQGGYDVIAGMVEQLEAIPVVV